MKVIQIFHACNHLRYKDGNREDIEGLPLNDLLTDLFDKIPSRMQDGRESRFIRPGGWHANRELYWSFADIVGFLRELPYEFSLDSDNPPAVPAGEITCSKICPVNKPRLPANQRHAECIRKELKNLCISEPVGNQKGTGKPGLKSKLESDESLKRMGLTLNQFRDGWKCIKKV